MLVNTFSLRRFFLFSLLMFFVSQAIGQTHRVVVPNGYASGSGGANNTVVINTNSISICPGRPYLVEETATPGYYSVSTTSGSGVTFSQTSTGTYNSTLCASGDFYVLVDAGVASPDIIIEVTNMTCSGSPTSSSTATFSLEPRDVSDILDNSGSSLSSPHNVCVNPAITGGTAITLSGNCSGTCGGTTSYLWSHRPSGGSYTNLGFTSGLGTLTRLNSDMGNNDDQFEIRLRTATETNSSAPAPAVCYHDDYLTLVSKYVPELSSGAAAINYGADNQICENSQETITGTCTDYCPSSGRADSYQWMFQRNGASGSFGTDLANNNDDFVYGALRPAATSTTGTYQYRPDALSGNPLLPGRYDVHLQVTNDAGCTNTVKRTNDYIVNARPGVIVYHNAGDPANWTNSPTVAGGTAINHTGGAPIEICTGRELQLRVKGCDDTDYDPTLSNTVNSADPNNTTGPNGTFNTPCNGDYFAALRLRARIGGAGTNAMMDSNSTSGVYTAGATGLEFRLIEPHNSTDNTFTVRTMQPGVAQYQVRVTGANGCRATDVVTVNVVNPTITYTASSNAGPHASGATISGCEGDPLSITPICDLCFPDPTTTLTTWSSTPPTGSNTIATSPTNAGSPVVSQSIVLGSTAVYNVAVTGQYGCSNANAVPPDGVNIDAIASTSITRADYPAQMCSASELLISVTGHGSGNDYELYDVDPRTNPGAIPICSPCAESGSNPRIVRSRQDGSGTAGPAPVDGVRYYLIAYPDMGSGPVYNKDCPQVVEISEPSGAPNSSDPASVDDTPDVLPGTISPDPICNGNPFTTIRLDVQGADPTGWTIQWSGSASASPLDPDPNIDVPLASSYFSPYARNGSLCFTFFGVRRCLIPPSAGASLQPTAPLHFTPIGTPGVTGGGVVFRAVVTNNGCSRVVDFPAIDLLDCDIPTLDGLHLNSSGNPGSPAGQAGVENNPTFATVCAGNGMRLSVNSSNPSLTYRWSTGETSQFIEVMTTNTSPDSITRTVVVYASPTDSTVLTHTFRVSKANVNLYPSGDNSVSTIDTTICTGDILLMSAKCPTCKGDISYAWDGNSPVAAIDGDDVQFFRVPTPAAPPSFSVTLAVNHGPSGSCQANYIRTIGVNDPPTPVLIYQQTTSSPGVTLTPNGTATSSLAHSCVGQTAILTADCGSCPAATIRYLWNNGATSSSININGPGGYYVEVEDVNGCTAETRLAIITEAASGAATPAIATPTEICNNQPVTLEVAPCMGCTYEWFEQTAPLPAAPDTLGDQRLQTVLTPGTYFAQILNPEGCVYTTNTTVVSSSAVSPPNISSNTDTICTGQSALLSTTGGVGFQYQWYKREFIGGVSQFQVIAGATDSSYTTVPSDTGDFRVQVTYQNGCSSESPTLRLHSGSFDPVASAAKAEICRDETVEVSTPLVPSWQYQWYRNGISIPGETGASYYADSSGYYYVLVTNSNLCQAQTNAVSLSKSTLTKPNASTPTPTICPGEAGRLSVSLCSGCSYEWFNTNPSSVSTNSSSNFNYNNVRMTGNYFAIVSKGTCEERSDTVSIIQNQVFTPAINAISNIVCDGVDATLLTQGCVGCSYTWLLNNSPALGALNDTFLVISSTNDVGDYRVAVDYPNGCSDTSGVLSITDGSFGAYLTIDTTGGGLLDSVICNGAGEVLRVTDSVYMTGTYTYTLFLDNTPVTGYSNVTVNNGVYTFPGDDPGIYTVQIVNPNGCREVSNILPLRSVTLVPTLSARATSDPNSVPANTICTDSSTVFFQVDVPTCSGCTYIWRRNSNNISGATSNTYQTLSGVDGVGLYIVSVTEDGCVAASNPLTISDSRGTVNTITNTNDTSICNGDPVTLLYTGPGCVGCSYRWLSNGSAINGATSLQYVATTAGDYFLELTTPGGCIDVSDTIRVQEVIPPTGLVLDLDSTTTILGTLPVQTGKGTPLASNPVSVNLNSWVFPPATRNGSLPPGDSSYFTSTPFSANINCGGVLPCYPGLSGTDNSFFTPADTLAGFFNITYYYRTNGCTFTTSDILEVLEPAAITISNANTASVPYEACITDVLTIQTNNLTFPIGQLFAFDVNGNYIEVTPSNIVNQDTIFGGNTFWNSTVTWTVPDSAYASNLMMISVSGTDTVTTPFLLIHNTDLSFSGLPSSGELCSNGDAVTLFGNPTGGSFAVEDLAGNAIAGTTLGDTLYPSLINHALFNNGEQQVNIVYNYTETYTNGNACPDPDRVAVPMTVKDVRLTGVTYNNISISQTREKLTNLVYRTYPYEARPNKQQPPYGYGYTIGFSGSFTSPAGSPEDFLPSNAGVGNHALTYHIQNGTCMNSVEDSITVVPAPIPIGLPDTICRDFGIVSFARDGNFPFNVLNPIPPNTTVAFTDSVHVLRVRGAGVTPVNTNLGAETFTYDPNIVPGNHDTLVIEYVFYRDEDTLTVDFDTLEYVVASIVQPIYVENPLTVQITDTIVSPFYCQENQLQLLAASPPDTFGRGLFMLFGGTNQYQNGDTLFNSVINPFDVNNLENATTTYDLVYILNGAACRNADTMQITIAKGLNPAFATANGLTEFCDDDPAVNIIHNVLPPDTAIWKIGGIPQPTYSFSPVALNPGLHIVELQQIYTYTSGTDTFVCSESATNTFTIHALPAVAISPGLDAHYCANDSIVDFVVSPAPDCPVFGANGHYLLDENFDSGIPASWSVVTNAGASWVPDAVLPQGGAGGAAFVDTSAATNDSWIVSAPMDLIAGHTYRLTYMVRAGDVVNNCSGFCDASMRVAIGTAATPTSITAQLDYQPLIGNDLAYVRYTVDHYHDPGAGFVTGQYFMGFHNFSPAYARSLRLDNVEFRDLTVDSCAQAGIGYVTGPGVFKVVDSLYRFDPLAVTAGNFNVAYEYTDTRGCSNMTSYNITVDTAPVVSFTNLDPSYCENEPTVMLIGTPLGGNFSSTQGTNLINIPFSAPLDTAFFPVNFQTNTIGTDIVSYYYLDANGCSETARDTVVIVPLLDENIISSSLDPLGYGHCVNAAPTVLDIDLVTGSLFPNGVFYGPGVRNGIDGANGNAFFYPDSAYIDLGHTGDANLSYIYTTSTGCADTAFFTTTVHALPDLSFTNLPDSMCLNRDSFQIVAQNRVVTGPIGQTIYTTLLPRIGTYNITDASGAAIPNIIDVFDTIYPYAAGTEPWIYVEYTYQAPNNLGRCVSTIYDSVRIDSVPVVYFDGLKDYYCENEPVSTFLGFPSYYVGSGYLDVDTLRINNNFYDVDPAVMVGAGQTTATYPTYYTYTDTRGCTGEVYDTFEVRPYPRIAFAPNYQDTFCRDTGFYDLRNALTAPIGGFFTDNLALTSVVDSFFLNLNSIPGPRLVTYHYTDPTTLCSNKDDIWIYLFSAPQLDFDAFGGCSQMDITFQASADNLIAGVDSLTSIWWDFEGNGTLTYTSLGNTPITIPDTTHFYNTSGVYDVTLSVSNQGSCVQSVTKQLIVSPYYDLATGDYSEDFNVGAGDWHSDQLVGAEPDSIWTHEFSIAGSQINHGDGAWVTMGDDLYQPEQKAWVYSPCFDFTSSRRPMLAFDLWRDMLYSIDGVVWEYYDNGLNQWITMGGLNEGVNWYQSDFVLARPGNQLGAAYPMGWTGRSGQFESARLRLDQFKGQRDIRFRVAFATAPKTVIDSLSGNGYEGAAFDNVWIGERTRNVLVEHFSNENYTDAASNTSDIIDQSVYNTIFNPSYGLDVILLQYQVDNGVHTGDPVFNSPSRGDLNARRLDYSANPNDIFIDGEGTGRSTDLDRWEMDKHMLADPKFEIVIDPVTIRQTVLSGSATVTALEDLPYGNYIIRMAAIQDSTTYNTRGFNMLSIVRDLIPDNSGFPEIHSWTTGQPATVRDDWDFDNSQGVASFNPSQLEVVVFIQDDSTKEVYQAASTQDVNRFNGTQQLQDQDARTEIFSVNVYPNPSSDYFNVGFDAPLLQAYNWRIVDVSGRTLEMGIAPAGTQQFGIDAERLVDGAYFLVIHSEDQQVYAQRKLIVIKN